MHSNTVWGSLGFSVITLWFANWRNSGSKHWFINHLRANIVRSVKSDHCMRACSNNYVAKCPSGRTRIRKAVRRAHTAGCIFSFHWKISTQFQSLLKQMCFCVVLCCWGGGVYSCVFFHVCVAFSFFSSSCFLRQAGWLHKWWGNLEQ